jgi:trimethylamine--corrinoid protein Co-methyltransferase
MSAAASNPARPSRRSRARPAALPPLADKPFRLTRNPFPPLEPLSAEQLRRIDDASMRILEEIGIDFLDGEALDLWEAGGARVDHSTQHVWIERGHLRELLATAPREFIWLARNPARDLPVGGDSINFATVGGAPFYSDLEGGRRPGTLADYQTMVKLAQQCGPIHVIEALMVEPQDVPVPVRHLDKGLAQFTLGDKAITAAAHGREVAADYVAMAGIALGGLEPGARGTTSRPGQDSRPRAALATIVNANSPLRFDERMLGGLITYARHGQATVVTPFILAGAMSPVTLAAAIAQQNAEALAGIALTQLVRPGAPAVYGGFTTNIDMQTGSPAFGTPEGALALLCGGQLARHYGLPFRGSGGLNNAKEVDAQASYETQLSLWPAVMAHANIILHSAGWLEAGLVCSIEKFVIDVEGLAVMQRMLEGVVVDDETLALSSIAEVGPGGHHFGTAHTLARYRSEFYMPIVSDRQNYEKWREDGSRDAARRAHTLARQLLDHYEPPPMDAAVAEELAAFVARRKRALLGS